MSRGERRILRHAKMNAILKEKVKRAGLERCREILSLGELELVDVLDAYQTEVQSVVASVAEAVTPKPRTAFELLHDSQGSPLLTGMPGLDAHLGGFREATLTEVVGPSGVGKTQLCHALAAQSLIAGSASGAGVIYIDTERSFDALRLHEMLLHVLHETGTQADPHQLARRLLVARPSSWAEYSDFLDQLEEVLVQRPTSLIVVDSIAAPARAHFGGRQEDDRRQMIERGEALVRQAAFFKKTAEEYELAVVVSNQVQSLPQGTQLDDGDSGLNQVIGRDDVALSACLGNTWAHCVNVRLVLEFPRSAGGPTEWRELRIAKAPVCPLQTFRYVIGAGGLQPVAGSEAFSLLRLPMRVDPAHWLDNKACK